MSRQTNNKPVRLFNPFVMLALGLLLFVYWNIAREIEAVDYVRRMPLGWRDLLRNYPLLDTFTPIVAFGLELLSLKVLRHFIPVAAGCGLAYFVVLDLVQQLYNLPDRASASSIFARLRGNTSKPIRLNRDTFKEDRLENPALRIGGPGSVLVAESDVIVTEINGRFERVMGKGKHRLKRFEYVYAILDLTVQQDEKRDIRVTTKDGIDVVTNVVVNFRIQRNNPRPNQAYKFTFDSESVRKAAYAKTLIGNFESGWQNVPVNIAVGQLKQEIANRTLDELIDPSRELATAPHPDVQSQMRGRTRQILRQFGLELISASIGGIMTDESVQEKMISYWQASGGRAGLAEHVPQDPERLRKAKENKIKEQMIQNLANGLHHMQSQGVSMYRPPASPSPARDLERLLPILNDVLRSATAMPMIDPTSSQNDDVIVKGDELNEIVRHLIEQFGGSSRGNSADNRS